MFSVLISKFHNAQKMKKSLMENFIFCAVSWLHAVAFPAGNSMFKVNNRNIKKRVKYVQR